MKKQERKRKSRNMNRKIERSFVETMRLMLKGEFKQVKLIWFHGRGLRTKWRVDGEILYLKIDPSQINYEEMPDSVWYVPDMNDELDREFKDMFGVN